MFCEKSEIFFMFCRIYQSFLIEISFQPKKNILFYFQKAKALKQKKEEGNTAFKAGQLDEAYSLYR